MSARTVPAASPPLVAFLQTPLKLRDEKDVDECLRRDHPVVHLREGGALKEAQLNASTNPEEDFLDLASAHGAIPGVSPVGQQGPKQIVYMLELELLETIRIESTTAIEKAGQLRAAELARENHAAVPHAVWLPVDEAWPSPRLRIVASDSLLEHFVLLRTAEILPRLLRKGSFPTTR